jgi:hypothetical protein
MSKYTKEVLEPLVAKSESVAQVLSLLGLKYSGGSYALIQRRIRELGIDRSHFKGQGWAVGRSALNRKSPEEVLVLRDSLSPRTKAHELRRALIESGVEYSCSSCGLKDSWNGKPIVLEIHHVNGQNWDDRAHNLMFMCPNCHSQY